MQLLLLLQPFYSSLDFVGDYPGKPVSKTNLDLLEQEIVSGSGISWAICKSAPHSRQITMQASHHSVFYRLDALPATQPTASMHRRMSEPQRKSKMQTSHMGTMCYVHRAAIWTLGHK